MLNRPGKREISQFGQGLMRYSHYITWLKWLNSAKSSWSKKYKKLLMSEKKSEQKKNKTMHFYFFSFFYVLAYRSCRLSLGVWMAVRPVMVQASVCSGAIKLKVMNILDCFHIVYFSWLDFTNLRVFWNCAPLVWFHWWTLQAWLAQWGRSAVQWCHHPWEEHWDRSSPFLQRMVCEEQIIITLITIIHYLHCHYLKVTIGKKSSSVIFIIAPILYDHFYSNVIKVDKIIRWSFMYTLTLWGFWNYEKFLQQWRKNVLLGKN